MTEPTKITSSHRQRTALVYIRQSTMNQVACRQESTARQYALAEQAKSLGWTDDQITVIDEDLGISGASAAKRPGCLVFLATVGAIWGPSEWRSPKVIE